MKQRAIVRLLLVCLASATLKTHAATYVVDQAAPGAADVNSGTEATPFKTVQHAADLIKAGDTIFVMAGNYPERVKVKRSGAAGQPIAFLLCHAQRAVVDGDEAFSAAHPVIEYNLTWTDSPAPGERNIHGKDPLFVDPAQRNFRLKNGSPAIGSGLNGGTIGALDYPNVYFVDPNHPAAADDPPWGYPAVPLATLAKACAIAQPGEAIVVRGGIYREALRPGDGVTVRAGTGENVTISGADLVEGWKRELNGEWSAPLASAPRQLLRDGDPWNAFSYDEATQRIVARNGDPRLHVFETVVRAQAIDLAGRKDVRVVGIGVTSTLSRAPLAVSGETRALDAPSPGPTYPLKRSSNGRYLVDLKGAPFLIAGDAPQGLMVKLTEADADLYCSNRVAHGFNSLWINLLCRNGTGGRKDGATYDGILPFTVTDDLSTPNDAYFARCDRMLSLAQKHGLLVILDPAETIDHLRVLVANGPEKCRQFGRYLGERYKRFPNLIWMSGNDFQTWREPQNDAAALAVAKGIRERDPEHLQTVELNYEVSGSLDDPNWAALIDLSCAYTYYPTYAQVLKEYNRANFLPVVMIESDYEFEQRATPAVLRREEYWSLLSGAAGQVYGCGPIWPFAENWKSVLNSTGAVQMAWVKALFEPRTWFDLVPDQKRKLVIAGYGTFDGEAHEGNHYVMTSDYVTAARTPEGHLGIAYMPSLRPLKVDLAQLSGPVTARWYDPSRGTFSAIKDSPFPNSGKPFFIPPGNNADGDGDWVLVLETNPVGKDP